MVKELGFYYVLLIVFSKDAWVISLKGKESATVVNAFQKVLDKSNHKSNKTWVDEGCEFCNSFFKKCIQQTMKESLLLLKYLL